MKKTKLVCFKCGAELKKEKDKTIDYPYFCPNCDENMYSFEAVEVKK